MKPEPVRICPFCDEEDADVEHVSQCSLRDAQIISARNGQDFSMTTSLLSKISRIKTLCGTFETASPSEKERMWCCQECYAFGEGDVIPDECHECKSFATSPACMFIEEDRSS